MGGHQELCSNLWKKSSVAAKLHRSPQVRQLSQVVLDLVRNLTPKAGGCGLFSNGSARPVAAG